jgi:hypothetical protein
MPDALPQEMNIVTTAHENGKPLQPDLCSFVSAAVYQGKLAFRGGLRDATAGARKECASGIKARGAFSR